MSNNFLYRIIKFEHLVETLTASELYFSRPSAWDDPYEQMIDHPQGKFVFGQCWCKRGVSDAMWRIYSPNHMGVRIKVKRTNLKEQITSALSVMPSAKKNISDVEYRNQSDIDSLLKGTVGKLGDNYEPLRALSTLLFKRMAFDHEKETRVLIHAPEIDINEKGLRIGVEPSSLIESILADPRMPPAVFKSFKYYVTRKLDFTKRFERSTIYENPEPFRVGFDDED